MGPAGHLRLLLDWEHSGDGLLAPHTVDYAL